MTPSHQDPVIHRLDVARPVTRRILVDANTIDLVGQAGIVLDVAREVIEARYAGELMDAVTKLRDLNRDLHVSVDDIHAAVREVCDRWNPSDTEGGAA